MMASKGFLGDKVADLLRSEVEADKRSVALMPSPEELAWTWDAAYNLCKSAKKKH